MAITTRKLRWRRWSGQYSDFTRAARYANGVIERWSKTLPDSQVEIVFRGDRSIQGNLDDLASVDPRDLADIREISIRIDRGDELPVPGVSIRARHDSPAISVQIRGDDPELLAGARAELMDILDRGKPRVGWWETPLGGVVGFLLFVAGVLGGTYFTEAVNLAAWLEVLIVIGFICFAIGVGVGLWWVFPHLQLLEPGGRTRFQRFKIGVYAFVLAVATSLVASIIWALANR